MRFGRNVQKKFYLEYFLRVKPTAAAESEKIPSKTTGEPVLGSVVAVVPVVPVDFGKTGVGVGVKIAAGTGVGEILVEVVVNPLIEVGLFGPNILVNRKNPKATAARIRPTTINLSLPVLSILRMLSQNYELINWAALNLFRVSSAPKISIDSNKGGVTV